MSERHAAVLGEPPSLFASLLPAISTRSRQIPPTSLLPVAPAPRLLHFSFRIAQCTFPHFPPAFSARRREFPPVRNRNRHFANPPCPRPAALQSFPWATSPGRASHASAPGDACSLKTAQRCLAAHSPDRRAGAMRHATRPVVTLLPCYFVTLPPLLCYFPAALDPPPAAIQTKVIIPMITWMITFMITLHAPGAFLGPSPPLALAPLRSRPGARVKREHLDHLG